MKTVKFFLVWLIALAAISVTTASVQAAVFKVGSLYYKKVSETEVSVCPELSTFPFYTPGNKPKSPIEIPSTVTDGVSDYKVISIGAYALYACDGLKSITIPSTVRTIEEGAFAHCTGLTSVSFSKSVQTIGVGAFAGCTALKSVIIPNGVTVIEERAFWHCTDLVSVLIPNSVQTIKKLTFSECTALSSITIPQGVKTIEESAFYQCTGLTSVSMSNSVQTIGETAFGECTSLISITIPEGVKTIRDGAFYACSGLTSVTLPASVTTIKEYIFSECYALKKINVFWTSSLPAIDVNVFEDLQPNKIDLWVPAGTASLYNVANTWKDLNVKEVPFMVMTDSLMMDAGGETQEIAIVSNINWSISSDQEWLTLSTTSGMNSATVEVTAMANPDTAARMATVFFTDGLLLKKKVVVMQAGKLPPPVPDYVALDYTDVTLPVGASICLQATIYPENVDMKRDVVWRSFNEHVATVSGNGKVTALAKGQADINVFTEEGNRMTRCRVTVVPVANMISVTPLCEGKLLLSLMTLPEADFTLSFDVSLPEGFMLDQTMTAPDSFLSSKYEATVSGNHVELKPSALRIGMSLEKRDLMTLGYKASSVMKKGSYGGSLTNVSFVPEKGYTLTHATIPFNFMYTTSNVLLDQGLRLWTNNSELHISLPVSQTIYVYSISGALVKEQRLSAGDHSIPLGTGLYIVRIGTHTQKIAVN